MPPRRQPAHNQGNCRRDKRSARRARDQSRQPVKARDFDRPEPNAASTGQRLRRRIPDHRSVAPHRPGDSLTAHPTQSPAAPPTDHPGLETKPSPAQPSTASTPRQQSSPEVARAKNEYNRRRLRDRNVLSLAFVEGWCLRPRRRAQKDPRVRTWLPRRGLAHSVRDAIRKCCRLRLSHLPALRPSRAATEEQGRQLRARADLAVCARRSATASRALRHRALHRAADRHRGYTRRRLQRAGRARTDRTPRRAARKLISPATSVDRIRREMRTHSPSYGRQECQGPV